MHIDDFIDRFTPLTKHATSAEREAERYARFVLSLLRMPAALRHDFEKFIPKLFCTWRGKRYEVTHASHHGYVGLTQELALVGFESAAPCAASRLPPGGGS